MAQVRQIILFIWAWVLNPSLIFLGFVECRNVQVPIIATTPTAGSNYSVGFSLASSYGAAAVIIDTPDGRKETPTWVVQGDEKYRSVMARLSLESSQHLAPPYLMMDQYFLDIPRVTTRRFRKRLGLPASHDVGILAGVIKELRSQIEADLGITVLNGTLTNTHLIALYQDDIEDICTHAGFRYVIPKHMFKPMLFESASGYAGYGFGMCENWRDEEECDRERERFPAVRILSVHYSPAALVVTPARASTAIGVDESMKGLVSFELGSDARRRYASEKEYWTALRREFLRKMREYPVMETPERIIFTGEDVDEEFRQVLEVVMVELIGSVPPISADDALVVAAKGAAEFRRRGTAVWSP